MSIVKLKTKGQMTLPSFIRKQAKLRVGDYLSVQVESGKITVTPQSLIDRELALSLEDVKLGRMSGPFATADEAIRSLRQRIKRRGKKVAHS